MQPSLGRVFTPEEATPGHDSVVVLTHSAWTRLFAGDPNVIGRRVTLAPPQEPEALARSSECFDPALRIR